MTHYPPAIRRVPSRGEGEAGYTVCSFKLSDAHGVVDYRVMIEEAGDEESIASLEERAKEAVKRALSQEIEKLE